MLLNIHWKIKGIKRWWNNQGKADRLFLYMNTIFVLMVVGVPLLGVLFGIEIK